MVAMNDDQIRATVLRVLEEAAPGAKPGTLDPAVPFRDQFEFDSIDFVNFVFGLERTFALVVNEVDCPLLSTLDGCVAYLGGQLGGG